MFIGYVFKGGAVVNSLDEEMNMKIVHVLLGLFLWVCIPVAFVIGIIFGLFAGGIGGGLLCAIGVPFILFILGLFFLLSGIKH